MKKFIISTNDAGKRLDKFVAKAAPGLSTSLMYKYIRKKSVKLNGGRCNIAYKLREGDVIEMYINDEFFTEKSNDFLKISYDPCLDIVYEDENVMLVNKKPGVLVHEDADESRDTLINQVLLYLYKKGDYIPVKETSFTPSLCNRLDKNTGGIVIVAKNAEAQRLLYDIVKNRKLKKLYLAVVHGKMNKKSDTLHAYLKKNPTGNTVEVRDAPFEDAREIITGYRVLREKDGLSLLEIDLITGRTHQIRAHLAHIGHPVAGDGKYGSIRDDKNLPFRHQALYAYSLEFKIDDSDNPMSYLDGRIFSVDEVYFLDFLFGSKKVSNIEK